MAIYAVTGKPRHGKTYFVSTLIPKMLKNKERIFCNFKLNVGIGALKKYDESIIGDFYNPKDLENPDKLIFYWRHIHQWEHMKSGTIIADEGTRYFNSRQWALLSEDTEIKLQQHGKEGLDIWLTTQHYTRLDVSLRLLVEKFFIVTTIFGNPDNKKPLFGLKIFRVIGLELEDMEDYYFMKKHPEAKMEIDMTKKTVFFRKKYGKIYDTLQMVGKSESMPLVHKVRTCPICKKEEITHK